jgi:hypothetical protein
MTPIIQKSHFEFRYTDGRSKPHVKDKWLCTPTRRTPPGRQNRPSWAGLPPPPPGGHLQEGKIGLQKPVYYISKVISNW